MAIHFNSQAERMRYLKGEYEEIIPVEAVEKEPETSKNDNLTAEIAEKPQKTASKRRKSSKKAKEDSENDEI